MENHNIFNFFLKTDSQQLADDDLILISNQIVTSSDFQNHVILLVHYKYLRIVKTK